MKYGYSYSISKKYERSKSLADMYVYYERLKQDGYTQLYYTVKKNLGIQRGSLKEFQKTSENLRRMGAMERAKEIAFIQKVFHKPISVDFDDRKSVKEFIDVLNEVMNFKDLYKRNLQLLLKLINKKLQFPIILLILSRLGMLIQILYGKK